jgi:hypothetical protein
VNKIASFTVASFVVAITACSAAPEAENAATTSAELSPEVTKGCPASPPADGVACALINEVCTFGTDPRFGCRTLSTCTAEGWSTKVPDCAEPAPRCPSGVFPITAGDNVPCSAKDDGLTCVSGEYAYTCAPYNGDLYIIENGKPLRKWWQTELESSKCPHASPNQGAACSVEGASCNYGACMNDPANPNVYGSWVSCTDGIWQYVNHACI